MKCLKPFFFLSLLSIVFGIACNKEDQQVDLPQNETPQKPEDFAVEIDDSKVPYVIINTGGASIQNEPKIPATLYIFEEKELVKEQTIGIEYRGSTSFRISDKKSFGIETWTESGEDMDVSFFDMPEEEDWVLIGHVINQEGNYAFDRTLLYHYIGYEWSRDIGRYASRTQLVELEINGEYLGVYIFGEKLKRDGDRIAISRLESTDQDLSGGYILKIDKTTGGSHTAGQPLDYYYNNWQDDALYTQLNSFRSVYDVFGNSIPFQPYGEPYHSDMYLETYFQYEYPKAEEISDDQKSYISGYIYDFESALLADDFSSDVRTYTDYIDIDSFVDYLLLTELTRNVDAYRLSTYLQKDKGGKLAMGPIWDLNIGYDSGDRIPWDGWVYDYNTYVETDPWLVPFWWTRLMTDPVFTARVKSRWEALRAGALSTSMLSQSIDEASGFLIDNGAIERNYNRWQLEGGVDYGSAISQLKEYIEFRTNWMDGEIGGF
jgi:hypothetical protein